MHNTEFNKISILSAPLHLGSRAELLGKAERVLLQSAKSYHFMALNPIKVIRAQKEPELQQYLSQADVVYADGVGICVATRMLYGLKQERIPGYELHFDVLRICEHGGHTVYILGSRQEILSLALVKYKERYPNLKIVGGHHGYFSDGEFYDSILNQIRQLKPRLVLVAMGAKIQERWIESIRSEVTVPLLMGIGGSLDAFVTAAPRAPKLMLRLGLEWLYRLIRQPRRYKAMTPLPVFAVQVLVRALHNRQ